MSNFVGGDSRALASFVAFPLPTVSRSPNASKISPSAVYTIAWRLPLEVVAFGFGGSFLSSWLSLPLSTSLYASGVTCCLQSASQLISALGARTAEPSNRQRLRRTWSVSVAHLRKKLVTTKTPSWQCVGATDGPHLNQVHRRECSSMYSENMHTNGKTENAKTGKAFAFYKLRR